MSTQPTLIRFSTDRKGRQIAHRWCDLAQRLIRMGLDEAKLLIASGAAVETPLIVRRK